MIKYDWMKIDGIMQIGANDGTELYEFENYTKNIIMFEPVYLARLELIKKIWPRKFDNTYVFDYVVSNKDDPFCDFFEGLESGNSSLFELNPKRSAAHSHNIHKEKITCQSITLDTFYKKYRKIFKNQKYNLIYMDVQGAEPHVIEGGREYIRDNVDYVYCEVSHEEVYDGTMLFNDFNAFMRQSGFALLNYEESISNPSQGDALYLNKNKI